MLWKEIELSEPSDIITICSEEESLNLMEKWSVIGDKNFYIPADIFLKRTVPIYDFVLKYKPPEGLEYHFNPVYRFIVFKDFEKQLDEPENNNSILLGVVIANFEIDSRKIQLSDNILIFREGNYINVEPCIGYRGINLEGLKKSLLICSIF